MASCSRIPGHPGPSTTGISPAGASCAPNWMIACRAAGMSVAGYAAAADADALERAGAVTFDDMGVLPELVERLLRDGSARTAGRGRRRELA